MKRMVKDLKDGDTYIYANSRDEYDEFVDWIVKDGWEFAYHFEVGEAFQKRDPDGFLNVVEVNGL